MSPTEDPTEMKKATDQAHASLARLSPARLSVYINLNPIVAAVLGVLLLSERATPMFLLSFVAVIAGLLLVNWPVRK